MQIRKYQQHELCRNCIVSPQQKAVCSCCQMSCLSQPLKAPHIPMCTRYSRTHETCNRWLTPSRYTSMFTPYQTHRLVHACLKNLKKKCQYQMALCHSEYISFQIFVILNMWQSEYQSFQIVTICPIYQTQNARKLVASDSHICEYSLKFEGKTKNCRLQRV